jgi:hypothetical protein
VWLSISGGVAVAYVFIHLLPELAAGQVQLSRATADWAVRFAERHVYLVALLGLAVFYGLERLAKESRGQLGQGMAGDANAPPTSRAVFWIHMISFGIYNALIGYLLLHLEHRTTLALAFFTIAMALHFVVTDFGLSEDHQGPFRTTGRWILSGSVLAGFALGIVTEVPESAIAALVAFLAGGVILNVIKEEVPSERRSRFWAFALGMAAYSLLLLTV